MGFALIGPTAWQSRARNSSPRIFALRHPGDHDGVAAIGKGRAPEELTVVVERASDTGRTADGIEESEALQFPALSPRRNSPFWSRRLTSRAGSGENDSELTTYRLPQSERAASRMIERLCSAVMSPSCSNCALVCWMQRRYSPWFFHGPLHGQS